MIGKVILITIIVICYSIFLILLGQYLLVFQRQGQVVTIPPLPSGVVASPSATLSPAVSPIIFNKVSTPSSNTR